MQVLSLSRLNEMIKSHRDNSRIVEPLLKSVLLVASTDQVTDTDTDAAAGDILDFLTASISQTVPSNASKSDYLKICLNVMSRIQSLAPEAREVIE